MSLSFQDRVRGMMLGLAIGDALGAPIEGRSARKIRKTYKGRLTEIVESRGRDAGYTTDDTALTVALAESMLAVGGYDPVAAMDYYLHWFFLDGHGMGTNTKFVFKAADEGLDPAEAAEMFTYLRPERVVSNGALMRCSPIAAWYSESPQNADQAVTADAQMTHYSPISSESCVTYNRGLIDLLNGRNEVAFSSPIPVVHAAANAPGRVTRDLVTQGKGMVLVALAASTWAVRSERDFEDVMVELVNWGGDADTNGAIAGALLGAKHGPDAIPERWISKLVEREYFIELADRLVAARPAKFEEGHAEPTPTRQRIERSSSV
jgi:ADP-ribosyl-[dinitrogen reductase] hydrolase